MAFVAFSWLCGFWWLFRLWFAFFAFPVPRKPAFHRLFRFSLFASSAFVFMFMFMFMFVHVSMYVRM